MKKVIFVTGFNGCKLEYFLTKFMLRNKFEVIYFKFDTSGRTIIEKNAEELDKFIKRLNLKKKEKINIIGLSMGGLIADYYLKFIDNKKTTKLITIFSPFKGTFWARIFYKKNPAMKEMRPNSKFLKRLNKAKIKKVGVKSIWCPLDFLVPGASAKYLNSIRVWFFLHHFNLFWPPFVNLIKRNLK